MAIHLIPASVIEERLVEAIGSITFSPDPAIKQALQKGLDQETSELPIDVLNCLISNLDCASEDRVPLCQDTGSLVVFVEIGSDVHIEGGYLPRIIDRALQTATQKYYLRFSIVQDPLYNRSNTGNNTPAIVHYKISEGDGLTIKIAQKGGGAENMSRLKMFTPSSSEDDIIAFVLETVQTSGSRACPPLIIGIGIGGNFETCALLAKEALLLPLNAVNQNENYAKLEQRILKTLNESGIGAQGMGGITTALAVHIGFEPCHIASLPVAVNLQCHAHRHIEITI